MGGYIFAERPTWEMVFLTSETESEVPERSFGSVSSPQYDCGDSQPTSCQKLMVGCKHIEKDARPRLVITKRRSARGATTNEGESGGLGWQDTLAEWLRRRLAKPMGSARVGSNPIGVATACLMIHCVLILHP